MKAKKYYESTRMVSTNNWSLPMVMNFAEEYHKAKTEEIKLNEEDYKKLDMLYLFNQFGWKIKTGEKQKRGSCADIYAEQKDNISEYFMLIDDGYCEDELKNALYHVYANNFQGKIFEGRIGNEDDFRTVMRVLGFKKVKNERRNFRSKT